MPFNKRLGPHAMSPNTSDMSLSGPSHTTTTPKMLWHVYCLHGCFCDGPSHTPTPPHPTPLHHLKCCCSQGYSGTSPKTRPSASPPSSRPTPSPPTPLSKVSYGAVQQQACAALNPVSRWDINGHHECTHPPGAPLGTLNTFIVSIRERVCIYCHQGNKPLFWQSLPVELLHS